MRCRDYGTVLKHFDLPLMTHIGGVLEAQGAYREVMRWFDLWNLPESDQPCRNWKRNMPGSMRRLKRCKHFSMQSAARCGFVILPGGCSGPIRPMRNAVDCEDGAEAVERGVELLDSMQRRSVAKTQESEAAYSGSLPAVIAGDRRMLEITEVKSPAGSAGIALDRNEIEEINAVLRRTTETHAQTLDHLATAIAMFDAGQRLQFYNSSFQKLWGLEPVFLNSTPTNAEVS